MGKVVLFVAGKMVIKVYGVSNLTGVLADVEGVIPAVNFIFDAFNAIAFGESIGGSAEASELEPGKIAEPLEPTKTFRLGPPLSGKSKTHRCRHRRVNAKLLEDTVTPPPPFLFPQIFDHAETAW